MRWLVYLCQLSNPIRLQAALRRESAALRRERIALRMVQIAQETAQATKEQLMACRGLLETVKRERDDYDALAEVLHLQLDAVRAELEALREERFEEHQAMRFWITRTITPREVSLN